jgi:hypothetical protein
MWVVGVIPQVFNIEFDTHIKEHKIIPYVNDPIIGELGCG